MITIELDRQYGLAYVRLPGHTGDRGSVARTTSPAKGVNFDYDKDGQLIGIELLHVEVKPCPAQ
jgi:hypothetical protein